MRHLPSIVLLAFLVAACVTSYRWHILPHEMTLGGVLVGLMMSVMLPRHWHTPSSWQAFKAAMSGMVAGALLTWMLLELMKKGFGSEETQFEAAVPWRVIQPDDSGPPVIQIGDAQLAWEDVFVRQSDRLVLDCDTLQIGVQSMDKAQVLLGMETVTVKAGGSERTFPLGEVTEPSGTTTRVEIPQEIVGFGLVFLLALTGAFVGLTGIQWVMGGTAVLYFLFAVLLHGLSRAEDAGRVEMAPFILLACLSYLLLRRPPRTGEKDAAPSIA